MSSVALTLTFLSAVPELFEGTSESKQHQNHMVASVPLVLTFVKVPAAMGCECQNRDIRVLRPKRHRTSLQPDRTAIENEKTRPGGQPDGSSHMALGVDGRSRQI
jgi:hypothetical protein